MRAEAERDTAMKSADRIRGALSLAPMTVNELAKRLCMKRNTVAASVDRMIGKGAITCWEDVRKRGRPARRLGLVWRT